MPYNSSTSDLTGALVTYLIVVLVISLVVTIFFAIIYWKIFAKAGYSGALGLLMFVPIANLIVLCVLAFGEWPIYGEINALRQEVARMRQYMAHPQFPPPQQYPPRSSSPQYPQYPH